MVRRIITDPFQQTPQKAGHHSNVDRIPDKTPLSSAVQVAWWQGITQHAMILCICKYKISSYIIWTPWCIRLDNCIPLQHLGGLTTFCHHIFHLNQFNSMHRSINKDWSCLAKTNQQENPWDWQPPLAQSSARASTQQALEKWIASCWPTGFCKWRSFWHLKNSLMVMIFLLATLSAKSLRAWFQTYTAQSCALPPGRPTTTAQPCSALRSHSVSCHNFRWRSWWLSRCRPPSPNSNLHKDEHGISGNILHLFWTLSMSKIKRTWLRKVRDAGILIGTHDPPFAHAQWFQTHVHHPSASSLSIILYHCHCQYMLVPVILWFQAALEHPVTVGLEDLWTIYTVTRHLMVMPPCPYATPSYATFIRGPLQNLCGHAQCMTSLQVFHLLRLRDMESEPTKTQIQKETNQDSKRQGDTVFSPPKNETLAVAAQLVARMGMALLQGNDAWPKGRNEAVYWGNQSQWGWAKSWKMWNNLKQNWSTRRFLQTVQTYINKSQDFTNFWTN